jgi:hypothetical protein
MLHVIINFSSLDDEHYKRLVQRLNFRKIDYDFIVYSKGRRTNSTYRLVRYDKRHAGVLENILNIKLSLLIVPIVDDRRNPYLDICMNLNVKNNAQLSDLKNFLKWTNISYELFSFSNNEEHKWKISKNRKYYDHSCLTLQLQLRYDSACTEQIKSEEK